MLCSLAAAPPIRQGTNPDRWSCRRKSRHVSRWSLGSRSSPRDEENASVSISGPSRSSSTIYIAGRAALQPGAAGGNAHDPELSMHLDVVVGAANAQAERPAEPDRSSLLLDKTAAHGTVAS
jgi:hypothetical protein